MSATLPGLLDADLPKGVRSRFVDRVNGLRMHVLEAGSRPKGSRSFCYCTVFPNWLIPGAT